VNGLILGFNKNLIESTEVSNFGLGRKPDKRTTISNDHVAMLYK